MPAGDSTDLASRAHVALRVGPADAAFGSPTGMRIGVLGVGCSKSKRNLSTAFAIECAGEWIGLDCPHPIRYALAKFADTHSVEVDVEDITTWLITHVHADHCSGLESVAFLDRFQYQRRTRLAAHPEVLTALWDRHLAAGMADTLTPTWPACLPEHHDFDEYFEPNELDDVTVHQIGVFQVELRRTRHVVPTFGVRVTAGGVSFAYSSDTVFDADLVTWLEQSDLVAHDTASDAIHASVAELAAAVPLQRRHRWMAVHHGDDLDKHECATAGFHAPDDAALFELVA